MSQTLYNGQSLDLSVPSGQSIAISSIRGTYTATIVQGANTGTALATASSGGATFGPYATGAVIRLSTSADGAVDFDIGASPTNSFDQVAKAAFAPNGEATGIIDPSSGALIGGSLLAVPSNRSVTSADFERELSIANGVALTIPVDATLGITSATYSPTIMLYAAGASAFTLVTTGLTMRGSAPTFAQYGWYGIKRVGSNEWAYL